MVRVLWVFLSLCCSRLRVVCGRLLAGLSRAYANILEASDIVGHNEEAHTHRAALDVKLETAHMVSGEGLGGDKAGVRLTAAFCVLDGFLSGGHCGGPAGDNQAPGHPRVRKAGWHLTSASTNDFTFECA